MSDRPVGDELDRALRDAMVEITNLAAPVPELNELLTPAVALRPPSERRIRPRMLVALGSIALVVVALVAVLFATRDDNALITDSPERASTTTVSVSTSTSTSTTTSTTTTIVLAVEPSTWERFAATVPSEDAQLCSLGVLAVSTLVTFSIDRSMLRAEIEAGEFGEYLVDGDLVDELLEPLRQIGVIGSSLMRDVVPTSPYMAISAEVETLSNGDRVDRIDVGPLARALLVTSDTTLTNCVTSRDSSPSIAPSVEAIFARPGAAERCIADVIVRMSGEQLLGGDAAALDRVTAALRLYALYAGGAEGLPRVNELLDDWVAFVETSGDADSLLQEPAAIRQRLDEFQELRIATDQLRASCAFTPTGAELPQG